MNKNNRDKIICLLGPTAVGKTDLAISLTKILPCEIISVDSGMVYRGLDIGTAKPNAEELATAPHRLIDICDPIESYSVGKFREDAIREIEHIKESNKIPLLVGGTMLYFKALEQGLSELPSADLNIRKRLSHDIEKNGISYLYEILKKVDAFSASRIKPNDKQRIQRALEVYELTGKTLTDLQQEHKKEPSLYTFINVALLPKEKTFLHGKIIQRFDAMLKRGFLGEVKGLIEKWHLTPDLPAMRLVGYKEAYQHLQGEIDFEKMRSLAIIATSHLAKRQMTWLRNWMDLKCFTNSEDALKYLEKKF